MGRMNARYPGTCDACHQRFEAGTAIFWDRSTKATRHAEPCVRSAYGDAFEAGRGVGSLDFDPMEHDVARRAAKRTMSPAEWASISEGDEPHAATEEAREMWRRHGWHEGWTPEDEEAYEAARGRL